MTHPISLDGHLIQLQKLAPLHLNELEKIAADPIIWQYLLTKGWQHDAFWTWAIESLEEQKKGKAFIFVVMDNQNGRIVGTTRFQNIEPQHNKTDIGWTWYAPSVWGCGFNFEAKSLMFTHAFETWRVHRVGFKVDECNLRSQRALEKVGTHREGYIRKHLIRPDGSIRNSFLYGLTDEDWFSTAKQSLQNRVVEAIMQQKTGQYLRESDGLMLV